MHIYKAATLINVLWSQKTRGCGQSLEKGQKVLPIFLIIKHFSSRDEQCSSFIIQKDNLVDVKQAILQMNPVLFMHVNKGLK